MKLLAEDVKDVFGTISPPPAVAKLTEQGGAQGLSIFFSNIIQLIYVASAVAVVIMVVWGSFEWIISGGDKEKVASARKRITYAIIGIVLLASSFFILSVLGRILGFDLFKVDTRTTILNGSPW